MILKDKIYIFVTIFFTICYTNSLFSQIDTVNNKPIFDSQKKSNLNIPYEGLDTKNPNTSVNKNDLFKSNDSKIFTEKPKRKLNFKNSDDDVLNIHYYNGKMVTNKDKVVQSNYSLGTIYMNSKFVKIEVRDFGIEDGDRIKVYVNDVVVQNDITLKNLSFFINVNLKNGYNSIAIKALNQGYLGPNTAELEVYDDKGNNIVSHDWHINTGEVISIGIYKK